MASILKEIDAVAWLAGKNFSFHGKHYEVGDEIPEINEFPRLEVYVRTRHVIPVVETKDDIPFQFRHIVMTRERAVRKLQRGHARGALPNENLAEKTARNLEKSAPADAEHPSEDESYDPSKHSVDEVLAHVGEDSTKATEVYVAEEQGKNRSTLLTKLEAIINKEDSNG